MSAKVETTGALEIHRDAFHHDTAVALASLPGQIRGYGHVRARGIEAAHQSEGMLLATLHRRVIPLAKAA